MYINGRSQGGSTVGGVRHVQLADVNVELTVLREQLPQPQVTLVNEGPDDATGYAASIDGDWLVIGPPSSAGRYSLTIEPGNASTNAPARKLTVRVDQGAQVTQWGDKGSITDPSKP